MSINQGTLVEIARETENTKRILERISDEHLDWRPHEKSMTLGALAGHVVQLHNWVGEALSTNDYDIAKNYKPFNPKAASELAEQLNQGYDYNVKVVEGLSQEDWSQNWVFRHGEHVIMQMPKIGAFRFMIQNHLIHHRGQLTVYLRLLNIPVPGLYGPSADESQS